MCNYYGSGLANQWLEQATPAEVGMDENQLFQVRDYAVTSGGGSGVSAELSDAVLNADGLTQETDYIAATSVFGQGDFGSPGSAGNTQNTGCIPGLLGDVDDDNSVNSADALIILSQDASTAVPAVFEYRINQGFGDVNQDGLTNSTDAVIIISFDVQIPMPFPTGDPTCL